MDNSFTAGQYRAFDDAGKPLAGGLLYTYAAGTLTPLATYTTQALSVSNANPVVLDSTGRAKVWTGAVSYRFILKTAAGVTLEDNDNIGSESAALAGSTGSALIGHIAAGAGAIPTTIEAELRKRVSVTSYGADKTGATDIASSVAAALTVLAPGGTLCFDEPGNYLCNSAALIDAAIVLPVGVNLDMAPGAWLISTAGIAGGGVGGSFIAALGNNVIRANIDGRAYPSSGGVTGTWATWANTGIRSYFNASIGLGAADVTIFGSEIKNCTYAIQAVGSVGWHIYGNKIHRTQWTGALMGFYAGYDCLRNIITGNFFDDHGDYAVAYHQVGGQAEGTGAYNITSDNNARNMNLRTNGYAFGVEAGDPVYQHHFLFANNTYECTVATGAVTIGGITVSTCADSVVIGNVLRGGLGTNGDVGVNCRATSSLLRPRNVLIAGNVLDRWRGGAVSTNGGDHVTVAGNQIRNCGDVSVNLSALNLCATILTSNITVSGNSFLIDSTYPHYGAGAAAISAGPASGIALSNVKILNNVITNPNDSGIAIYGVSGTQATGIDIVGNHIIGTGDATFFKRAPIVVDQVAGFTVCGNIVKDAARGFSITNSSAGIVGENVCRGSVTMAEGWLLSAMTSTLLRNNEFHAPMTAKFSAGSEAVLTTGGNLNRATGGSGVVVQAKGVTGAIATGATVAHGMSVTPTVVHVSSGDSGSSAPYPSAIGSTTFVINYTGGGTHVFHWSAAL